MILTRLVSLSYWGVGERQCQIRVVEERNRDMDEAETIDDLLENISCDGEQRNGQSIKKEVLYESLIFKLAYTYLHACMHNLQ